MEDFTVQLINYGALGVVLGYFIYKDNKTMIELKNTVQGLREVVLVLKEKVNIEDE